KKGMGFSEVGLALGEAMAKKHCARGAAFGDFDNDGDLDVVINNIDGPPLLLRNDGGNTLHWLEIKTLGTRSNRDGTGCRIQVMAGGQLQIREIKNGSSYISSSDVRAHFGLGSASTVDVLKLTWPSGKMQNFRGVPADHIISIREDDTELRLDPR